MNNINNDLNIFNFVKNKINNTTKYRGEHFSQHSRQINFKYCSDILKFIDKKNFIFIPPGDYSDRGKKTFDINNENKYADYFELVKFLKNKHNSGTINTIKKNIFVELDRMGLLDRFENKKKAKLTELAKKMISDKNNILEKKFIWINSIRENCNLFFDILDFLRINNFFEFKYISAIEVMLFLNDKELNINEKIKYIKEFKKLSKKQKQEINDILTKKETETKNNKKNEKFDLHNWKNQTKQIFFIMNEVKLWDFTIEYSKNFYETKFLFDKKKIDLKNVIFKRNPKILKEYLKEHNVTKKLGFNFHHIVDFKNIKYNYKKFIKYIENWKNLIYINGQIHNSITYLKKQNYYHFNFEKNKIKLNDFLDKSKFIEFETIDENILLDKNKLHIIRKHNKKILESF